jgi:hypothetical protein
MTTLPVIGDSDNSPLSAALDFQSFAYDDVLRASRRFFPHFVGRCSKLPHLSSTTLKLSHLQSRPVGVPRQGSWPRPDSTLF